MNPAPEDVVIAGAGLTGLLLARELRAKGRRPLLLEKSRGPGGRMSTKRVEGAVFDQGAQFFTARTPRFAAEIEAWCEAGVAAPWPDGAPYRYVGRPAMNAVGKHLSAGLEIRREAKVLAVKRNSGAWEISVENQPALQAGELVLTAPVPQSLALLAAGGVALPDDLAKELRGLDYHPCLAQMLTLSGPSALPAGGLAPEDGGPVRWIADNTRKGVSPGTSAAVTVHLAPAFSEENYGRSEAEVLALVSPVITPWLGAAIAGVAMHRWRYSEPKARHREPCVWLPDLRLGMAGDAIGGPRVEGAATSAFALADRMAGGGSSARAEGT
ncbi:MAG: NAD(P)/FAD-dependent oxidoreductase [Opitutaceae bacterium]